MFDKYVDNLIPRSDYGELVPYLGAVADYFFNISDAAANDTTVKDGTFAETKGLFGLCRKDGTIVTDPVYASVQYCDGYYLLKKASVDTTYDLSDFRGNFYVVLDTQMPVERVRRIFETLQPAAILTDKSYIDKVKSINNFKNDNAINSTSITEQSCENSPIIN